MREGYALMAYFPDEHSNDYTVLAVGPFSSDGRAHFYGLDHNKGPLIYLGASVDPQNFLPISQHLIMIEGF